MIGEIEPAVALVQLLVVLDRLGDVVGKEIVQNSFGAGSRRGPFGPSLRTQIGPFCGAFFDAVPFAIVGRAQRAVGKHPVGLDHLPHLDRGPFLAADIAIRMVFLGHGAERPANIFARGVLRQPKGFVVVLFRFVAHGACLRRTKPILYRVQPVSPNQGRRGGLAGFLRLPQSRPAPPCRLGKH